MKKAVTRSVLLLIVAIVCLVIFAYARTWGKTEIAFRIHINEQLVRESSFGESPTFAIWLDEKTSGRSRTVFATRRAAEGDWEGKAEVPVALPKWFEVNQVEKEEDQQTSSNGKSYLDASTGATPVPGYFVHRVSASPGSKWTVWIEVNLAGDFNETYQEYNEELRQEDEYKSGQPALLYTAELDVTRGVEIEPELAGMSILDPDNKVTIQAIRGITTATDIFDEITISVVKPKPRLIKKRSR